jgi:hypothetical protein
MLFQHNLGQLSVRSGSHVRGRTRCEITRSLRLCMSAICWLDELPGGVDATVLNIQTQPIRQSTNEGRLPTSFPACHGLGQAEVSDGLDAVLASRKKV